jgi:HlyD family secretion protein
VALSLRVRDSDRVKAGDILFRLDETQTLANATIVTKSFDELLARQARLETERDSADQIVLPSALLERAKESNVEVGRAITAERTLFDLRRQSRSGQKAQLQERKAQLQDEIKDYAGQARPSRSTISARNSRASGRSSKRTWCRSHG